MNGHLFLIGSQSCRDSVKTCRLFPFANGTLQSKNYEVLEAGSGAEAIRICKAHHEPIHLLIADVKVPDIPGTQVAL